MACLFQVATRHETLTADKQSLAPSTFLWLHLLSGSPAKPEPPNLRDLSELLLKRSFFFEPPSLRTVSSDINPSLSFQPYVQPISPR
ncbi:hypothetical protein N7471_004490 [Penicillium samsonianum]|uniref:uncharacterized protein n=1 Tax=Penicillium samsonianum TaxID=1882272 RepID=UPI002548DA66|nr:uncharacterized protein N7471_004490 [Penicillium samsonianum]KAJ6138004.1 hypothetical protein N7471_004490 [Penicillium samsonianum]